jgi:hypothetical protein
MAKTKIDGLAKFRQISGDNPERVIMSERRNFKLGLTGAAVVIALALVAGLRAQPPATEYQVKAAYLLNFGKFVTWPANPPSTTPDFPICVFGEDPFGSLLDATVRGEKIDGKPVVAQRIKAGENAAGCKVLFVGRSEEAHRKRLLAGLKKSGVLTVSDIPGFLDHGGMIQFVTTGSRVRFEVNLNAAQEGGIALSSELLKVATAVRGKPEGGR